MKNYTLTLLLIFCSSLVYGQAISVRYITAKKGENSQLREALKIKTQKYNTKDNQPKIYTFAVRASQKGKLSSYVRLTYAPTLGELSVGGSGQPGMMEYWMNNVDVHISTSSSNEIFTLRESATHNDAIGTEKPMRRVFHYNIKHGEQDNFWKIRDNLPKAIEKSGVDLDIKCPFHSACCGPHGLTSYVLPRIFCAMPRSFPRIPSASTEYREARA